MNYRVSHKYSGQWFEEALAAQNKIEIPFNSIRCTLQGARHYSTQQFTGKKKITSPQKLDGRYSEQKFVVAAYLFLTSLLCKLTAP